MCCQAHAIHTGRDITPTQAADTLSTNWMTAVNAALPAKYFIRAASIKPAARQKGNSYQSNWLRSVRHIDAAIRSLSSRLGGHLKRMETRWGEHPIADTPLPAYSHRTKHSKFSQDQNQKPAGALRSAAVADLNQNGIDFAPSPDEVSRKAYFTYVNQGSPLGRDVQHWLDAEAQLIAERNLTRVHEFHNQT